MTQGVTVEGYRELKVLFAAAPKEAQRELNKELRTVAEPIRADAAVLAVESIRRIGPTWSQMRTGVTRKMVYVAPKQRGVKTRGPDPRRRPNLARLLQQRAMDPALKRHENEIAARTELLFDHLAAKWTKE